MLTHYFQRTIILSYNNYKQLITTEHSRATFGVLLFVFEKTP